MSDKIYDLSSRKKPSIHKVVADCFGKIANKPCWGPQLGHGSFLTLEFGEPHLLIEERETKLRSRSKVSRYTMKRDAIVHGEWHLWIYCCFWSITMEGRMAAHSESSRETIESTLAQLRGQKLINVSVTPKDGSSVFEFERGGKIQMTRDEEPAINGDAYENWMFFDNQRYVLTYRGDGKYSYHPANEIDGEWLT